jgi:hypothetical protein
MLRASCAAWAMLVAFSIAACNDDHHHGDGEPTVTYGDVTLRDV